MKVHSALATLGAVLTVVAAGVTAASGQGFYGDAPDEHHPWAIHDANRPQPKVVTPGRFSSPEQPGKPPSDAVVLFGGTDLLKWEADKNEAGPSKWVVKEGAMECTPGSGYIRTKDKFGDCQLHVEWAAPKDVKGDSQGRGNSGIFLEGICEIQVLDNYNNATYADGHAASVYGVNPPMANALRPPGEWQVADIVFRRPVYKDGKPVDPGYVTVFVNGVLVQDHTVLEGPTGHKTRTKPGPFPDKGPLKLQDHGNPVRFRNIWYRDLPPRACEGGTDGPLPVEAAMAKRKEIAASIRQDAEKLKSPDNPLPELLRRMESLQYEKDDATVQKVQEMAARYIDGVKRLPADKIASKKGDVKRLSGALQFLAKFNILLATWPPKVAVEALIKDQRWEK